MPHRFPLLLPILVTALLPRPATGETRLWHHVPIEDGTGKALHAFHKALRLAQKGEGRARLTFYGDSHTAEDQYTGFLRQRLQKRFGDAGPGFILPAQVFPLHAHQRAFMEHAGPWEILRVRGRHRPRDAYGLAGVALRTTRPAWGAITLRGRNAGPTRFDIYYLRQPLGGQVAVTIDGREVDRFSTRHPQRQPGYLSVDGGSGRRLELRAQGDGPVRLYGVSVERGTSGVIVDALGVPGAKGRDQLPWDRAVHKAHLQRAAPDLMVLEYGTNESGGDLQSMARYERDLRAVVERLRSLRPEASCLLLGPTEWPEKAGGRYRPRARTRGIIEVQRRVAGEQGCGFFDTLAFMGGPGSMSRWIGSNPPLALTDRVHLTDAGHGRLAEALEQALLAGL